MAKITNARDWKDKWAWGRAESQTCWRIPAAPLITAHSWASSFLPPSFGIPFIGRSTSYPHSDHRHSENISSEPATVRVFKKWKPLLFLTSEARTFLSLHKMFKTCQLPVGETCQTPPFPIFGGSFSIGKIALRGVLWLLILTIHLQVPKRNHVGFSGSLLLIDSTNSNVTTFLFPSLNICEVPALTRCSTETTSVNVLI